VAQSIAAVADRAEAVAARLRFVLGAKITTAAVTAAGRLRSVRATGELGALGRLSGESLPKVTLFADREGARRGLPETLRSASNRFFRGATAKARDFRITDLPEGGYRMEFFSPAENPGYGKLYVQVIDADGGVVSRFKDTLGPDGLIERKWIKGGPS
jgi:hypothetical protein